MRKVLSSTSMTGRKLLETETRMTRISEASNSLRLSCFKGFVGHFHKCLDKCRNRQALWRSHSRVPCSNKKKNNHARWRVVFYALYLKFLFHTCDIENSGETCDLEHGILIGWGIGEMIGYVMCMICDLLDYSKLNEIKSYSSIVSC